MIIPVRCWTCNKVIGHLWNTYVEQKQQGTSERVILDKLGLKRVCCRRHLITHIDLIEKQLEYCKPSVTPVYIEPESTPVKTVSTEKKATSLSRKS